MLATELPVNIISRNFLRALPSCTDCGLLMRKVFSEEDTAYFVCPCCRIGIEIPIDYLDEENQC